MDDEFECRACPSSGWMSHAIVKQDGIFSKALIFDAQNWNADGMLLFAKVLLCILLNSRRNSRSCKGSKGADD